MHKIITRPNLSPLVTMCFGFQKHAKNTRKFKQRWFGPYKIQYCLHNNTTFMVILEFFYPNPILVNINKLKPY
jgi:hypothetical protein